MPLATRELEGNIYILRHAEKRMLPQVVGSRDEKPVGERECGNHTFEANSGFGPGQTSIFRYEIYRFISGGGVGLQPQAASSQVNRREDTPPPRSMGGGG